jgi:hypothetical protein
MLGGDLLGGAHGGGGLEIGVGIRAAESVGGGSILYRES